MKHIYTKAFILFFYISCFNNESIGQIPLAPGIISFTSPSTNSNWIDTLHIACSLTFTPTNPVQITFTYTGGYYKNSIGNQWILTMKTASNVNKFTFSPLLDTLSSNPFTISPSTPMPDGIYSAFGHAIPLGFSSYPNSATNTNVSIDCTTLPGALIKPEKDSTVSHSFLLYDSIAETASSKKIIFNGPVNDTLTMNSAIKTDSFLLNTSNVTSSSPNILSATSNTIADGVYTIKLQYSDTHGHTANITTVSNVTIGSVLPVSIEEFNGSLADQGSNLYWQTSGENNISFFEVEFSSDGKTYTSIGTVNAKENLTGINKYSFTDANTVIGDNYYRLKIVDKNGSSKYSSIVTIKNNQSNTLTIYPNPVKNILKVQLRSNRSTYTNIKIFTTGGKLVRSFKVNVLEGHNYIGINLSNLTPGIYILKSNNSTTRFIKQN